MPDFLAAEPVADGALISVPAGYPMPDAGLYVLPPPPQDPRDDQPSPGISRPTLAMGLPPGSLCSIIRVRERSHQRRTGRHAACRKDSCSHGFTASSGCLIPAPKRVFAGDQAGSEDFGFKRSGETTALKRARDRSSRPPSLGADDASRHKPSMLL